ncbi:MAG: protein kinase domain-containing protein [Verrucomicrobiales bacterium]
MNHPTALEIYINIPAGAGPEEISDYLDEACGGDLALRAEVEEMRAQDDRSDGFMEGGTTRIGLASVNLAGDEKPGDVIGHYQLVKKIGEGGFGVVYAADQREPVKREVALKILKLGMDTRQVLARFKLERQALAMMDHAGIAKVFDAGATETGRPYFVMELVRGVPITRFCKEHRLDLEERLTLFIEVCGAVQHAHQKGIIHRDLKPSNVLVSDAETVTGESSTSTGRSKIIDFGIAKAITSESAGDTLVTLQDQFIGTPHYMSPEQAQSGGGDIDTRSDIYSLGVLLYELLTGTTPFDPKKLSSASPDEMRRVICKEEPARPSTRISRQTASPDRNFRKQSITSHALAGDLDWIVIKALEKDRTRRYETANALVLDIRRHLDHEPVTAAAPSVIYRLGKFARRNRAGLAVAAAIALLIAAGVIISLLSAARADRARIRAETAEWMATFRMAEELLASGRPALGVAHLAKLKRENPENRVVTQRLMAALTQREFPQLRTRSMPHAEVSRSVTAYSRDGTKILIAGGKTAEVWDAQTGRRLGVRMTVDGEQGLIGNGWFDPAGDRVVVTGGASDGFGRIWDWRTGKLAAKPIKIDHFVEFSCPSRDGKWILTGSLGQASVWDAATGELKSRIKHAGSNSITGGGFSPDSKQVVTSGLDSDILVWSFENDRGEKIWESADEVQVRHVQYSPAGDRIVSWSDYGTMRLWNAKTGKQIGVPMAHGSRVKMVRFSPDREETLVVSTSNDRRVRFWDSSTGQALGEPLLHDRDVTSVAFHPEGDRIVTGTVDGTVQVWELGSLRPIGAPISAPNWSRSVSFSRDGKSLLVRNGRTVRVMTVPVAGTPSQIFHHRNATSWADWGGLVCNAGFDGSGDRLVTGASDGKVMLWNTRTGKRERVYQTGSRALSVRISKDGGRVFVGTTERGLKLWCAEEGETGPKVMIPGGNDVPAEDSLVDRITLSPDPASKWVAAMLPMKGVARIFDAKSGNPIGEPLEATDSQKIRSAAFSPKNGTVLTAATDGRDSSLRTWDVSTGKRLGDEWMIPGDSVEACGFSPDGERIFLATYESVSVWEVVTRTKLFEVLHPTESKLVSPDPKNWATFTPDGALLITWSSDGTARIWDASNGSPHCPPLRHDLAVTWVDCSPDGKRVVTTSYDRSARVWDLATGLPISEPLRHDKEIVYAEFSDDGTQLVTTGLDATARLWELPPLPDGSEPEWIARWAEEAVGIRIDESGNTVTIPWLERERIRAGIQGDPRQDNYAHAAEWFYADPATRSISPYSNLTREKYVQNLIEQDVVGSLQEAVRFDPLNGIALGRLASRLQKLYVGHPDKTWEAEFCSTRATELLRKLIDEDPDDLTVWQILLELAPREEDYKSAKEAFVGRIRAIETLGDLKGLMVAEMIAPFRAALRWEDVFAMRSEVVSFRRRLSPGSETTRQSMLGFAREAVRRARWEDAKGMLEALIDDAVEAESSTITSYWMKLAAVHLKIGPQEEYEKLRQAMLDRFGESSDPIILERTVKVCCLKPLPDDEMRAKVLALAKRLPEDGPNVTWFALARGMAEYRAGNDDEAVECLKVAEATASDTNPLSRVACLATHSMALAGTDKKGAQERLEEAETLLGEMRPGDWKKMWHSMAFTELALEEAKAALAGGGAED